jgi:hypothetical protein
MAVLDYLCDELARYDIDVDNQLAGRIKRLITLGYSPDEIARGINSKFRWNDEHGRLDVIDG